MERRVEKLAIIIDTNILNENLILQEGITAEMEKQTESMPIGANRDSLPSLLARLVKNNCFLINLRERRLL